MRKLSLRKRIKIGKWFRRNRNGYQQRQKCISNDNNG